MRHPLAALVAASAVLLAGSACGGDDDSPANEPTCSAYQQLVNEWSEGYGAEVGEVGAAAAEGDEAREEAAVETVRELFRTTSAGMREEAEAAPDEELAEALTEAADGLVEIGDQIETYEDVTNAPELMADGRFANGGERVSEICAE